jgi:hypothetical protein
MDLIRKPIDLTIKECVDRLEYCVEAEYFLSHEFTVGQFNSRIQQITRAYGSQAEKLIRWGMMDGRSNVSYEIYSPMYLEGCKLGDADKMRKACKGFREVLNVLNPVLHDCDRRLFIQRKSPSGRSPEINGQSLFRVFGDCPVELMWGTTPEDSSLSTAMLREVNWTQSSHGTQVVAYRFTTDAFREWTK